MADEDDTTAWSTHHVDLRSASLSLHEEIATLSLEPSRSMSIVQQWANTSTPSATQSELLDALSDLAVHPSCTTSVAVRFYPLLPDILLRAVERIEAAEQGWQDPSTQQLYHTFATLLHPFPALLPLVRLLLSMPNLQSAPLLTNVGELDAFMLSTYRLLFACPSILATGNATWSSKVFLAVARSDSTPSPGARLLALRIFAAMEGVCEATQEEMQLSFVGNPASTEAVVHITSGAGTTESVDAWIVPLLEAKRVHTIRRHAKRHCAGRGEVTLHPSQLRPHTASLGGHLFYRTALYLESTSRYKETDRLQPVLSSLGQKLADRLPVLLSGPEACGKTSLIRYACSLLHPDVDSSHIITLQLGDQSGIDAKSLVGSFISSTKTPGTFEWTEGALTRAVRMGKWVVLEDIDRASSEVLSVVKPLVEDMCASKIIGARPELHLGARGRVQAGTSFALFSTRTTPAVHEHDGVPRASFFGHEHWDEVEMKALVDDDILQIVKSNNPLLALSQDGTAERLVQTWAKMVTTTSTRALPSSTRDRPSTGTVRIASFHDLMKWCHRIEASMERSGTAATMIARAPLSNQALQEEMAMEACDIFLGSAPLSSPSSQDNKTDRYSALVDLIASQLGVDRMAVWHSAAERRPECKVESNGQGQKKIVIGRAVVERAGSSSSSVSPVSPNFALTGPAARLMEKIAVCVSLREPTLIVGETGTGKTTVVQYLASLARRPLIALNLSQQTETSDLLGGFKPLDPKMPAMELHNEWVTLFQQTFSSRRNARFMQAERKALQGERWSRLYGTWKESLRMALDKIGSNALVESDGEEPRTLKARRLTNGGDKQDQRSTYPKDTEELADKWAAFRNKIDSFAVQFTGKKRHLVFAFVEGPLVKAIRTGAWILLDEINLATSETLDCLTALLQAPDSSIVLTERGDLEPVPRHPDFRLFACMNPATDVGKKDLPSSLRTRFTELYAPSPDADQEALVAIVEKYIGQESMGDRGLVMDVAQCYAQIRKLAQNHQIADGANQRPHYSIRTLSRALTFARDVCAVYGLRRAVWEGLIMTFTMLLDEKSASTVRDLIHREILSKARNAKAAASFVPPRPTTGATSHVQLGSFWVETGAFPLDPAEDYILTLSVQDKLIGLARAALTRRSPVLIQGPTSAGKTSAVEYLARRTGHKFVRINNHEHTDIQEYIGSYASDPDSGQLVFHEGLLVNALRQGHWIVLDELNLAPTDVLEALNRLLDDNRELVIPETGQVVKPHPHFMLFATQNPPGQYAGRKVLSRAFRNRFLEIHFQDVPQGELQTILTKRCRIAPSYAEKVVQVFRELQKRRQTGRVFDTSQAFVTLRDLFRWGNRRADNYQQLGENGYMLIGERARRPEDSLVVKQVIEEVINIRINPANLYDIFNPSILTERVGEDLGQSLLASLQGTGIVWTASMQRLVCLIASSLRYKEPVLLVGETGSGKTSVCEVLAHVFGRKLVTVNCHQSTDTADLIGGQRPLRNRSTLREAARQEGLQLLVRNGVLLDDDCDVESVGVHLSKLQVSDTAEKEALQAAMSRINQSLSLFEWSDGPLVQAMREGNHILLDEISLADDSVLERLNSVLEPGRSLVLAERSTSYGTQSLEIKADASFQVVGTMNPGGDYGKKELSPALRNRFTEIWVPPVQDRKDLLQIINSQWSADGQAMEVWAAKMVDFLNVFNRTVGGRDLNSVGLRDLIAWARFINAVRGESMPVEEAFANGAFMTFIDGVALHPWVATKPKQQISSIITQLSHCVFQMVNFDEVKRSKFMTTVLNDESGFLRIGSFAHRKGNGTVLESTSSLFNLRAKTPSMNAFRVLRAMQIQERAIMLEGSPGAGKTSLIVALAKASNCKLTRINLSDQTELSDLFGADLPVEGGRAGEFDWRDAAFLQAMQEGSWVLLDEMNLASQSVLEGLNSCLDHRGAVYIPELGRSFSKHPDFRIFAAQNPQHQGGGRKGLPKSFLNRFTKVHVEELHDDDFSEIITTLYPAFAPDLLSRMIHFNGQLQILLRDTSLFSKSGQPWEFNLRDLLRWLSMIHSTLGLNLDPMDPLQYFASLYVLRFRTRKDRVKVAHLYHTAFGIEPVVDHRPWLSVSTRKVQLGHVVLDRREEQPINQRSVNTPIARNHLGVLQALGECVKLAWPAILVGESRSGKTTLLRHLAQLTNCELEEIRLNSGTDAIDVIGGFQQVDSLADGAHLLDELLRIVKSIFNSSHLLLNQDAEEQDRVADAMLFLDEQIALLNTNDFATPAWQTIAEIALRLAQSTYLAPREQSLCSRIAEQLAVLSQKSTSQMSGKFAWFDGPVLRAMRKGCWLLLDDANLCSSSVLDRLNSLLEPGGNLVLSERGVLGNGEVEVITPHPHFRVFFALNPRYGELSRAMRNRGMELFLDPYEEAEESYKINESSLQNVAIWSDPLVEKKEQGKHTNAMLLAMLAQALPPFQHALAQHVVEVEQVELIEPVTHNALLAVRSAALKESLVQTSNVDGSFLQQTGLDLQLNPNTFRGDSPQADYSHQLQLLTKTTVSLAQLQQAATAEQAASMMSILQKSAMYAQGQDVEQLSREDRHLYSLALSIAACLQARLKAGSEMEQGAMTLIDLLLDFSGYLTGKWSSETLNDYSVTKIVVAKMQGVLTELSMLGMAAFDEIEDEIDSISRQVTLTSGHAIHHIWRAFLPRTFDGDAIDLAVCIAQSLAKASTGISPGEWVAVISVRACDDLRHSFPDLASSAVDIAATLLRLEKDCSNEDRNELFSVARRAISALQVQRQAAQEGGRREQTNDTLILSTLLLTVCYGSLHDQEEDRRRQDSLVNLIKTSQSCPKDTAIAVQASQVLYSDLGWVMSMFAHNAGADGQAGNTQDLFRPILLQNVLQACSSSSKAPFAELDEKKLTLKRLASLVGTMSCAESPSRVASVTMLLVQSIKSTSIVLTNALQDQQVGQEEAAFIKSLESCSNSRKKLQLLNEVVAFPHLPSETKAIAQDLKSCVELALAVEESDDEPDSLQQLQQLGIAAVRFGLDLIQAYLPNIAIDPLVTQKTEDELRAYRTGRLEEEKAALLSLEGRVTGNLRNDLTDQIDASILLLTSSTTEERKGAGRVSVKRTTDTGLLQRLHRELLAFSQQVLIASKIEELALSMDSTTIRGRLLDLQSTICALLQRLPLIYPSLWDLTRPFEHALSVLLLGLGLLLQASTSASRSSSASRNERMLGSLVAFPTSLATRQYLQQDVPIRLKPDSQLGALAVPLLLMKIRAVVSDMRFGGKRMEGMKQLSSIYDQLWHLWTLDEEHHRLKREEEQSLYKVKKLDMSVEKEEAREEEEFLQLFPEYTDIMEDADRSQENGKKGSGQGKGASFFGSDHVLELFNLHLAVFEGETLQDESHFRTARIDLSQQLMQSTYADLSEDLDRQSASLQVSLLSQALNFGSNAGERDFYTESDPSEATRLYSVVQRVVQRLEVLIREWPEQEVLQHIKQRCQKILMLESASPISRLLSALEGLLLHTEDWQIYASSKNTLQPQRDEITALIIDWRRLELRGWKGLLNKESIRSRNGVADMWFTLFQAVAKAEYEDDSTSELVSLLDQYLRSSTLGQYSTRLQLIHSLASYLKVLCTQMDQLHLQRVQVVLQNVHRFFLQFQSTVLDKLNAKRKIIEGEISDFVKLASWKDTNVHALKVSAAKTHRKLHRCLRKFRDALNEAVDPVLAAFNDSKEKASASQDNEAGAVPLPELTISGDTFDSHQGWHIVGQTPVHLIKLPLTLRSLSALYRKEIAEALDGSETSYALLDLSSTILIRSEELAKQTPVVWKKETEKLVKHLETRKRKAWSDLLRELRRIGMTVSSIEGITTADLTRPSFIYAVPLVEDGGNAVQESDRIHYRLLSLLPVLRATISSSTRNQDIHVSQLQKGLGFVENGLLAAVVERQKLGRVASQLVWLRKAHVRVATLAKDEGKIETVCSFFTDDTITHFSNCLDAWCRLQSALDEIQREAGKHMEVLPTGSQGVEACLSEIGQCLQEVESFNDGLRGLIDCFETSQCTLVSQAESQKLQGSTDLLEQIEGVLENTIRNAPSLRSMCIPTLHWLHTSSLEFAWQEVFSKDHDIRGTSDDIGRQSDRLISSILVIAQELRLLRPSQDGEKMPDRGIIVERQRLASLQQTLRVQQIREELLQFLSLAEGQDVKPVAFSRLVPFLSMYERFVDDFVRASGKWHSALLKLDITVCRLVISLASNGFCKPRQEEEQSGEAGTENDEQLEGGMGLGEGEGAEDVTDTLKDDEMMEELQTDKQEDKEGETAGEKNAREMQDDFEGDMGDVPKDEEDQDEQDEKEEEEQEPEVEEGVGEVDPLDLDAVDEKTWGGQEDENEKEGKDKSEKESEGTESKDDGGEEGKDAPQSKEGEEQNAEGAGQRGGEEDKNTEEPGKEEGKEVAEDEEMQEDRPQKDGGDDGEEFDEGKQDEQEQEQEQEDGEGLGRAIDEEAQQAEALDLDEDLNIDDAGGDQNDSSNGSDMDGLSAMGDDDARQEIEENELLATDEQEKTKGEEDEREGDEVADDNEEEAVPHNAGEEPMDEDKEGEGQEDDDRQGAEEQAQADAQDSGLIDDLPMDESAMGGDANQDNPANQLQSSKSAGGRQADAKDDSSAAQEGAQGEVQQQKDTQPLEKAKQEEGSGAQKEEQGVDSQGKGEEEPREGRPARSLGDALQDFKRNMDAIEESMGEEAREDGKGMPDEEPSEVEHIRPDQDSEMQALGAAYDDETLHTLNDVGVEAGEAEEESRARVDEEVEQLKTEEMMPEQLDGDQHEGEGKQDTHGGLMTADVQPERTEEGELPMEELDDDEESDESGEDDAVLEEHMDALFATSDEEQRREIAQELWKLYVGATADYAFTLSEQLRLILAPTKATKLTGDYKTGKRLNMRKIIPFIASDYLKDKIWLRRNLPQKREYQVLLSIDDSKSMLESKNMLLAFKSLALVCSALDKLEVGQIGVMKFGKETELLKGFDGAGAETIKEHEGGRLLERLQFQQRGTDVSAMLKSSYKVLTEARESQSVSANELWQLQIIVSDGICQDHTALRALLRRAAEERIMVVFVVLDSLQQANSSILTMNSVQYTTAANGKRQLQMNRYLDTFPFEYFIVVRDVADLPEVLSTTLRQWAQKIAEA